jgi:hypothetical protein
MISSNHGLSKTNAEPSAGLLYAQRGLRGRLAAPREAWRLSLRGDDDLGPQDGEHLPGYAIVSESNLAEGVAKVAAMREGERRVAGIAAGASSRTSTEQAQLADGGRDARRTPKP